MRKGTVVLLGVLLCLPLAAFSAMNTSAVYNYDDVVAEKNSHLNGGGGGGSLVGGDTIGDAVLIMGLPFYDTGNTCDFADDYDVACPYTGSTSPDVVYMYVPPDDIIVTISLCDSEYDTKVYVFDSSLVVVACNDDAGCGITGFQSRIDAVALTGGETYYIVVDGYGGDCGDYVIDVTEYEPCCEVTCPAEGVPEGEPNCYDDYVDAYNGGCNSVPPVFQVLEPSCEPITICGKSGTYVSDGMDTRDTDWYQLNVDEEMLITVCAYGEFQLQLITLDGTAGCDNIVQIDYALVGCCDTGCLTHLFLPGTYWIWVGPGVFSGYPCGVDYVLTIDGYRGTGMSPTTASRWGAIKSMFR
jgi:hypothetical protein